MNTFEIALCAFAGGVIVGAVLEYRYGPKLAAKVQAAETAVATEVKKL